MSEPTTVHADQGRGGLRELLAMLRLDLRTVRAASLLLVLLVAGAALLIVFTQGDGFAPLTTIIAVVVTVNLMSVGETHRLPLLYGALPVRRRTVITAHYLVVFAATMLATIPALLSVVIGGGAPGQRLWAVAAAAGVTLIVVSILLPVYVAMGAQKGGLVLIVGSFAIGAVGYLAQQNGGLSAALVPAWVGTHAEALGALAGIGLLPISWALAVAIYRRQDH